jgi:hypothetical protein
MDTIELQPGGAMTAPAPRAPVPAPQPHPRLEAPPFEGRIQRDAFVSAEVDGDAALRSFIERARTIAQARGDSLQLPPLTQNARLASPLG